MCISKEYISVYIIIEEIDDYSDYGYPYIYPYYHIDNENYYVPKIKEQIWLKKCSTLIIYVSSFHNMVIKWSLFQYIYVN